MSPLRRPAYAGAAWWLLFTLSLAVAGYASLALLKPSIIDFIGARSGLLRDLLVWHALAGAVALTLAPLQLRTGPRAQRSRWHRLAGRAYVAAVLVAAVAGLVLAPSTRGGAPAQAAFVLLSLLWISSTTLGVRAARQGDAAAHRAWMLRSLALTFAAVTLRIYLGLGIAAGMTFDAIYALAAWLSWVPNLLLVEWWWLRPQRSAAPPRRIDRRAAGGRTMGAATG